MTDSHHRQGILKLVRSSPTHDTSALEVYRLQGCAADPVDVIILADGTMLPPRLQQCDNRPFRLRILHFNDLHGQITHLTDHHSEAVLSRIASHIKAARGQADNDPCAGVLVLSGGDDLVSSLYEDLQLDAQDPIHVAYRLYSKMGVDAVVLGNHDFDRGIEMLSKGIRDGARFPVLAANLDVPPPLKGNYDPGVLFIMGGVRVGVIGLITSGEVTHCGGDDFRITHPLDVTRNLVPLLRPHCDAIILLTHLGRSLSDESAVVTLAGDVELAESLEPNSVDLIIGAHTHLALNENGLDGRNLVNGIPILQAGVNGEFLGEESMNIFAGKPKRTKLTEVHLIRTADLEVDAPFEQHEVQPLTERVFEIGRKRLGIVGDIGGLDAQSISNTFGAGELAIANFIADGMTEACRLNGYQADFSMIDRSAISDGLVPGSELTYADWFRVMPHSDCIYLYKFDTNQLALFLADNAYRIDRGGDVHKERGFVQFSGGLRYKITLGGSRYEARISGITIGGKPLDEIKGQHFTVASSSFLRMLCRSWEERAQSQGISIFNIREVLYKPTSLILRDQLVDLVLRSGGVTATAGAKIDGRLVVA